MNQEFFYETNAYIITPKNRSVQTWISKSSSHVHTKGLESSTHGLSNRHIWFKAAEELVHFL